MQVMIHSESKQADVNADRERDDADMERKYKSALRALRRAKRTINIYKL